MWHFERFNFALFQVSFWGEMISHRKHKFNYSCVGWGCNKVTWSLLEKNCQFPRNNTGLRLLLGIQAICLYLFIYCIYNMYCVDIMCICHNYVLSVCTKILSTCWSRCGKELQSRTAIGQRVVVVYIGFFSHRERFYWLKGYWVMPHTVTVDCSKDIYTFF